VQTKKKPAPKAKSNSKTLKKVPAKNAAAKVKVPPEFTMKQVKEIVALIRDAGTFTSFAYKTDEFEIELSVGSLPGNTPVTNALPQTVSPPVVSVAPSQSPVSITASENEHIIASPMIGTFYRRPSPNSPPFVEVGDIVTPSTDVCIVEVMKLLNTIPAECNGRVARILVEDGVNIEVGQPLMVIELGS